MALVDLFKVATPLPVCVAMSESEPVANVIQKTHIN